MKEPEKLEVIDLHESEGGARLASEVAMPIGFRKAPWKKPEKPRIGS